MVDLGRNKLESFAFVVAVCFAAVLCFSFVVCGYPRARADSKSLIEQRINPNEARPESLIRLPGIGIGKAAAIVTYRKQYQKEAKNGQAFRNCDDLQKVKGIGPKTVQKIRKWLKFSKTGQSSEQKEQD